MSDDSVDTWNSNDYEVLKLEYLWMKRGYNNFYGREDITIFKEERV